MLEFTDNVIGNISIPITEKDIENIIVTALESGSDYWMGLDTRYPEWDNIPKDEPYSMWATKLLLDGRTVNLYDVEDNNVRWVLTLDMLLEGIKLNAMNRSFDCDLENMDDITADCIVQYALFSEVVFG